MPSFFACQDITFRVKSCFLELDNRRMAWLSVPLHSSVGRCRKVMPIGPKARRKPQATIDSAVLLDLLTREWSGRGRDGFLRCKASSSESQIPTTIGSSIIHSPSQAVSKRMHTVMERKHVHFGSRGGSGSHRRLSYACSRWWVIFMTGGKFFCRENTAEGLPSGA